MGWFSNGQSWRGQDGEEQMTDDDWKKRGFEQAQSMLNCLPSEMSSPDEDGDETGGCYNGDYTEEVHARENERLDADEEYRGAVGTVLGWLAIGDANRDSD